MQSDYQIKRRIYDTVKKHLSKKEITIVSGIRQCGKSTLMKKLQNDLQKQGKKTLSLNFDFEKDKKILSSQESLLNKLELEFGNDKAYVFIDEIQRRENAGLYLKGLYDMNLPYKFIVTGSGSIELKEKIQESLAGRKRIVEMRPVNFLEFVDYKTDYKYSSQLNEFFNIENEYAENLLIEYLNYGGFPRIITEDDLDEKIELINEIFNSYIEKDLISLLKINKPEIYKDIISILASMSGQLINLSTIATDTQTSVPTLKKYLYYAEKTFALKKIRPFYKNYSKEIRKTPVYYFTDIGFMNYAMGRFGNLTNNADLGFVFQNFVFNILQDIIPKNAEIKYWRTTDKAEVDFIIDKKTEIFPVEVKYKKMKKPVITRSYRSFIEKYKPENAFLVNLELNTEMKIDETTVYFVPYYKLFFDKFFN